MKIMIASDIHGSAYYCQKMLYAFEKESSDKLLLLGDILYHGPRNDLPKDYAPKTVIELLNAVKDKILCVRGNCDAEVDQMVLDFPITSDYCILQIGSKTVFATHGHIFNENKLPPFERGSILLNGHTHVSACREHDDYIYVNPGSVSIPKENTPNGYAVLDESGIIWKTLDGEKYREYKF